MIPKVIHYCWLSNDPYPPKIAHCIKSWKKYCPDYKIINWNFERLGEKLPIWVKEAFDAKKYAFAADWVRAYVLYNYGGIYLDSDVEVLKPFDDLLHHDYFLSYEGGSIETIEAAVMGAKAGLPFFKNILDYYIGRSFIKSDGSYDTKPLPRIITEISEHRFQFISVDCPDDLDLVNDRHEVMVLPSIYFSPKSYKTGELKITSDTYSIHHYTAGWHGPKEKIYSIFSKLFGNKCARIGSRIWKFIRK